MSTHPTPTRSRSGLSQFAWDLLAEQMLLMQLAGSVAQITTGRPVVRVCRHCGTLASEAAQCNEPLCPQSWPGGHSFVDVDVRDLETVDTTATVHTLAPPFDEREVYRTALDQIADVENWWGAIAGRAIAQAEANPGEDVPIMRAALNRIADNESGNAGWIAHEALRDVAGRLERAA